MEMESRASILNTGRAIRVRGLVQGVGFRPCVWKFAQKLGVRGTVFNDADGVLIYAWAESHVLDMFIELVRNNELPLARVEHIEWFPLDSSESEPQDFQILKSMAGSANTSVAADAATCDECLQDIQDSANRRYRYPFANCTNCGPRLTIIRAIPYDRCNTSMSVFQLCPDCKAEYEDPADRRYHAQPTACRVCGPKAELIRSDEERICPDSVRIDDLDAAAQLIHKGNIVAIKGLGGFQISCDATNDLAVTELRRRKHREAKPFALMARDVDVVRRYCHVNEQEEALLRTKAAPIVLLKAKDGHDLSSAVACGVDTLGFMLPYTPLHHLLMESLERPIVFTSGNLSEEPQCIDNKEVVERLGQIADHILLHDREIVNRLDDSVVRIADGAPRILRRSRGFAPDPVPLPDGFKSSSSILAMGAELKNTLCLIKGSSAILTQHIGDLADARTFADYKKNLALYEHLFQHSCEHVVVDMHPEYLSTKLGKALSAERNVPLSQVQHHHAHIAACLAENSHPLHGGPVLGVALDGLGWGDDNQLWGGEFFIADYANYKRVGTFKPVALLGGTKAMLEPWRNTYAHIMAELGWSQFMSNFKQLELTGFLEAQPLKTYNSMLKSGTNVPAATSAGRLFDAVAAAIGICREHLSYEGQAACILEAVTDKSELETGDETAYPFAVAQLEGTGLPYIEPILMWKALFGDMMLKVPISIMAARFHKGLAKVIVSMVCKLTKQKGVTNLDKVALSGGVFQNKILLEQVAARLRAEGYTVLTHRNIPPNDGGIALGQAVICAARQSQ